MDVIDAEDVSAVTVLWFLASDAPSTSLSLCFDGAERTDRLVPDRLRVSPSPLLRLRGPWDPLCVRRPVYGSSKNSSGLLCPSSMLCFPFGVSRTESMAMTSDEGFVRVLAASSYWVCARRVEEQGT